MVWEARREVGPLWPRPPHSSIAGNVLAAGRALLCVAHSSLSSLRTTWAAFWLRGVAVGSAAFYCRHLAIALSNDRDPLGEQTSFEFCSSHVQTEAGFRAFTQDLVKLVSSVSAFPTGQR